MYSGRFLRLLMAAAKHGVMEVVPTEFANQKRSHVNVKEVRSEVCWSQDSELVVSAAVQWCARKLVVSRPGGRAAWVDVELQEAGEGVAAQKLASTRL